jgi:nucleotide-binding universal stress UspA family protein
MSVVVTNPEHESLARQLIEKESSDALAHLETIKASASDAGVDCKIGLRHGVEISQEIVDEAERFRADVIVMGRRGYTGLMRVMMGSNTAKVIGYAHCSVLVVPKSAKIEGKKILLAVDGSRYSDTAATTVMSIAKHLHAPVLVVSVVYSDHKEKGHTEAVEEIKRVDAFLSQEGISTEGRVLSGHPAEAIVEVAKARGVDLIVMGSHGRTGLDRVLLGSVSDRVIGYAECAVLVVKAA